MKCTVIIASVISTFGLAQIVSAQTGACAAQDVVNTCLSNQDIYLKTCTDQDYACLCKWHTAKLSCYENCPTLVDRGSEQGLKDTFCSIAQTYNTTISSSSSVLPSVVAPTTLPSNSVHAAVPSASASGSNTPSAASCIRNAGQGVLLVVAGVSAYFLI